jgi:NhaA family Na+:H+ antiporter
MAEAQLIGWLDRPVDATDHVLGQASAEITLVEYGSYACPYCRAANERIAEIRDQFGDRLRYVFRHKPLTGSDIARRAAALAERSRDPEQFWNAHVTLMTRSGSLTEDDLVAVAKNLGVELADADVDAGSDPAATAAAAAARARVDADERSAKASGVMITPTFFINSRRYDGPWDESSFADAILQPLGHRVRASALDFASWAPSTGVLLLLATIVAVALTNSPMGPAFEAFWQQPFGFSLGDAEFHMSLRHWIDDGLLSIFFLVVGLEIKREFTIGHLSSRRSAALPVAGAFGGMAAPVLLYLSVIPSGPWAHGWGVPMATDTAFAVALLVMLGSRVPVELRIFLTAAAIVDDIGAIIVVALFYSGDLNFSYLVAAVACVGVLVMLNHSGVYRVLPYLLVGAGLWGCVHAGGLHATLAGVILSLVIPTRPPANLKALTTQASTIIATESRQGDHFLRHGPSLPALRALDAIHDRMESPAARALRRIEPWSSYLVLPLFALANAGVVLNAQAWSGHGALTLAIGLGLVLGKPLGIVAASALAVWIGAAVKPREYSWRQLGGAGALAGIGFTMSLFIAGQAFPTPPDFAAAKIAVFAASVLAAVVGVAVLWSAKSPELEPSEPEGKGTRVA